jgi:hypothetical protein
MKICPILVVPLFAGNTVSIQYNPVHAYLSSSLSSVSPKSTLGGTGGGLVLDRSIIPVYIKFILNVIIIKQ